MALRTAFKLSPILFAWACSSEPTPLPEQPRQAEHAQPKQPTQPEPPVQPTQPDQPVQPTQPEPPEQLQQPANLVPPSACVVDDDCVAASVLNVRCSTGYCPRPVAVSRDELSRNPCVWSVEKSMSPSDDETCPPQQVLCDEGATCVQCAVPRCEGGICAVATAVTAEACEALGDPCVRLREEWGRAKKDFTSCHPDGTFDCSQAITGPCGCPVYLNGVGGPEAAAAAQDAADALRAAGCDEPCENKKCKPGPSGCTDVCWEGTCLGLNCL